MENENTGTQEASNDVVENDTNNVVENDVKEPSGEPTSEKIKVKIDGVEKELTRDEMIRDYQIKETSYQRMAEASKLSKSVQPFLPVIEALKKGDLSVLRELGLPKDALRKFSENELLAYIEEQELEPGERRAREVERERDKLKLQLDKEEKTKSQYRQAQLNEKAAKDIEAEIIEALKESGTPLKGNQRLVRRIAEDMLHSLDRDGKKPSAKQSRDNVTKGMRQDFDELMSREFEKDPDAFIDSLPKGFLDGLRKQDLKKVRNQMPIGKGSDYTNPKPRKDDPFTEYMKEEMKRG